MNPEINEFDIVVLLTDLSPILKAGMRGAVVLVHDEQCGVYEVEFVDDAGQTVGLATVTTQQIQVLA